MFVPQSIGYGEIVEVQTCLGAMTETVLETAISYSNACESGIIIHISIGTVILVLHNADSCSIEFALSPLEVVFTLSVT